MNSTLSTASKNALNHSKANAERHLKSVQDQIAMRERDLEEIRYVERSLRLRIAQLEYDLGK